MDMNDLRRFASAERMIPDAPVQASRTITIDASIEKVWSIHTNVLAWPTWNPYLRNAKLAGAFVPGTKLSYGGVLGHNLIIAMVREPELAMIFGKYMGYSAIMKWQFEKRSEQSTKVSLTESSIGFLIGTLYSNDKLGEHLQNWLRALQSKAERG